MSSIPDFVVAGAPKSGTTSLCHFLASHPGVFFSDPKEPCYWASDLDGMRQISDCRNLDRYLDLFAGAEREQRKGEGSSLYLYSKVALQNLVDHNPSAKVIALVRSPVEIAHAFHMQLCFNFLEDQEDFERAWRMQEARLDGRELPPGCHTPGLLQYREVAAIGSQLKAASRIVPENQLLILFLEDLRRSPGAVYAEVLRFLELPDDGRRSFPRRNVAMAHRAAWLSRVLQGRSGRRLTRILKSRLRGSSRELAGKIKRFLSRRPRPRMPLSDLFREELQDCFREEVARIEQLTGREGADWDGMAPRPSDDSD